MMICSAAKGRTTDDDVDEKHPSACEQIQPESQATGRYCYVCYVAVAAQII